MASHPHFATKPKTKLTPHQYEVLRIIIKGNESDDPWGYNADLDQILERVSKETTKQAMQFTIRSLIHNGMIVKIPRVLRRGRMRVLYAPTDLGKGVAGTRDEKPAFLESDESSLFEQSGETEGLSWAGTPLTPETPSP
jgi:hypothetical protein